MNDQDRQVYSDEFEAWATKQFPLMNVRRGNKDLDMAWTGWQAALAHRDAQHAEVMREEGLPWKVWHDGDLMAAFELQENAEEWRRGYAGKPWVKAKYTITGPDDPPKSHTTGIPENVVI